MSFDPQLFKSQFPLFSRLENQSLIYLDNAATTQKPQCVLDAITNFYCTQNGNAQRSSHRLSRAATDMVATVRQQATHFLGANSTSEVVFTHGATAALNMIAYGLADTFDADAEIVLAHSEHHANLLPWQRLASKTQSQLIFFPVEKGLADIQQWRAVVNERTRVISFSGASNVLGYLVDLTIIADIKQQFPEVIIVVDASQMVCHMPLQAAQWGCDFLVCSAHKMFGPTGVGLLYGKASVLNDLSPLVVGGEMVDKVEREQSTFAHGVQRLEAGTSSLSAIAGLGACLTFWQQQDRYAMRDYEQQLTVYLHQQLFELCEHYEGITVVSQADNNIGIAMLISVNPHFSLSDMAHYLDEHDIAVRVGDHCAQPLWQSLLLYYGADKGLRISLSAYNTVADIHNLLAVLREFLAIDHQSVIDASEDCSDIHWQDLLAVKSWQQRYKLLLRWGHRIKAKLHIREQSYRVNGCESTVWLKHYSVGEQHYFLIDSDSNVIKGLSVLLLLWFNGKTQEEIRAIDIAQRFQQLGLEKHLSPSRSNGFMALLVAAKNYSQ